MSSTSGSGAPKVVIGIPVHNSERFLAETLRSVAAQDYPNLEIVISDDASTDRTAAVCEACALRDPRVRVVRHPRRVGFIANYNSLLPYATGDYFLWVPHDDLYDPTYVRELVSLLEARPDAVLAYSATLRIDERGCVVGGWPDAAALGRGRTRLLRGLRYLWSPERQKFIPFRGVVRSLAVHAAGGLTRGEGEIFADDVWLFRLSLLGTFVYLPQPLCRKRTYPESASGYRYSFREWNAYLAAYRPAVREGRLSRHETAVLLAAAWLRQGWVAGLWVLARCARRILRKPQASN